MITAIRSFCRWCVKNQALPADPTAPCGKPNAKKDRRIERRMLLIEEWGWLEKALANTVIRNGQTGEERRMLYRTAIETGLRSGELRGLLRSSLILDDPEPHIIARASTTKNSKLAKQYISNQLARDLKLFAAKHRSRDAVFNVASRNEMARVLRTDLEDARSLWLLTDGADEHSDFLSSPNSHGEVIDFHALRHTCGAWLVQAHVTLAEVREIMRHSTITLTIDCYGHIAPDARSKSRQLLGNLLG